MFDVYKQKKIIRKNKKLLDSYSCLFCPHARMCAEEDVDDIYTKTLKKDAKIEQETAIKRETRPCAVLLFEIKAQELELATTAQRKRRTL